MEAQDGAATNGVTEVLGSVTDCEGGVQLRTSARVSKKLKLDSLAQAVEKKDASHEEEKKAAETVPAVAETKPRAKRVDWSPEDKCAFFEALNEYGKDVDAIHAHLTQKAKRRGAHQAPPPQEVKTKDQVRFFYYRMWAILSKHINFPSYIKKQTQELYALINFGELRKKVSLSNKLPYEKLSEMIYSGSTRIKFRGKVRKVRTPLCKALRKLNQIEESSEELRLPSSVTVELRPRTNDAWCRVQALAQNPRVRCVLPLHRRLESLLAHLALRWRSPDDRLRAQLLEEGASGDAGASESAAATASTLRAGPRPGTVATKPTIGLSEVAASSSKLSLIAYEQRFHPTAGQVPVLLHQLPMMHRGAKGRGVKRQRADSVSAKEGGAAAGGAGEEAAAAGEEAQEQQTTPVTAPQPLLALDCFTDDNAQLPSAVSAATLSPGAGAEPTSPATKDPVAERGAGEGEGEEGQTGWTQDSAGPLRIGDVYMMYGNDGRVQLDYWWEGGVSPSTAAACSQQHQMTTLAASLSKLLAIAKLQAYRTKGSTSSSYVGGNDPKAIAPKVRVHKVKSLQDNTQQDNQLKLQVCPLPLDEVFRRPIVSAPVTIVRPLSADHAAGADMVATMPFDKMRPRWCNRRGRPKWQSPGVVQRAPPPILPKAAPSPPPPPPPKRRGFTPIAPRPPAATPVAAVTIDVKVAPVSPAPERGPSPPSLSNLLDDLSLPSLTGSSRLSTPTFEGFLSGTGGLNLTSPSSSKDQWISQDQVADMSLSGFSFLNTLDTDMKSISDDIRISQDSQLRNLMSTDMATDLTEIIADLTETIKTDRKPD